MLFDLSSFGPVPGGVLRQVLDGGVPLGPFDPYPIGPRNRHFGDPIGPRNQHFWRPSQSQLATIMLYQPLEWYFSYIFHHKSYLKHQIFDILESVPKVPKFRPNQSQKCQNLDPISPKSAKNQTQSVPKMPKFRPNQSRKSLNFRPIKVEPPCLRT